MHEERQQQEGKRPPPSAGVDLQESEISQRAGSDVKQKLRDDLSKSSSIALSHQLTHDGLIHLAAIPSDLDLLVHGAP